MQQLLGVTALREKRMLGGKSAHFKRESGQLADLGKLKRERNKIHSDVPAAFEGIVPADHPFTCISIFESILRGEFPPLYSLDGVCKRSQADEDDPPVGWSPNSQLRGPVGWAPATAAENPRAAEN